MSWLLFAFAGPVLWAISTHLDKYLVERFFKNTDVAVLLLFTAFIGVLMLPFIWLIRPAVMQVSPSSIALIGISGILYMSAMLFYLRALQNEEASVVAPFFQAGPLFGYVLAYVVLGERLSGIQIIGGILIIAGALIVSIRFSSGLAARPGRTARRHRFKLQTAALMLACGFAIALSSLIFKVFALKFDFWETTFWMFVGEAAFGLALLCASFYRRQFVQLLRSSPTALLSINVSNELINLGGGLGSRYALLFGPLSLVQAIGSTTTLFVFLFGVMLSVASPRFGRESLSARELAQKGLAAAFVAAGVALLTR